MNIQILGMGCSKCNLLEANVRKAVEEKKIHADISKVTDVATIMSYGIMSTPALVIDGKVKCSGRLVDVKEIKTWL